jgi:hypothetical protein
MLATLGFLLAIHLSPELPVGTREMGAAASCQSAPAVAWNGRTGLAVWIDERGRYPESGVPARIVAEPVLRVSPMRADGSLVNAEGNVLFPAARARLASNGGSFMLAWQNAAGTHVVPLDESGNPDGPDTMVNTLTFNYDLVSNGQTYLFAAATGRDSIEAVTFLPNGAPYALKMLGTGPAGDMFPAVTTVGGVYAVVYPAATSLHLALLADDVATTDVVVLSNDTPNVISAAGSDDRVLISFPADEGVRTLIVGRDGKPIGPMQTIPSGRTYAPPVTWWDGANFLLGWSSRDDDFDFEAVRVSPRNEVLDVKPAIVAQQSPQSLSFVRTGARAVATWSARGDVYRRVFSSAQELFTEPVTRTPEVFSARPQSNASLAATGAAPLRVWREGTLDVHVMLSAGGRTIEVARAVDDRDLRDPSVALGGNTILVVWRNITRAGFPRMYAEDYRVYARRFALDGTALDAQPQVVEYVYANGQDLESGTAAVFDGHTFIVFWIGSTSYPAPLDVRAVRMQIWPRTLLFEDAVAIPGAPSVVSGDVHAVWTGNEVLVAWSSWDDFSRSPSWLPRPPVTTYSEIARLNSRSTEMKVVDSRAVWNDKGQSNQIALAWNGKHALLMSVRNGCVDATLLDASLATVANQSAVDCLAPRFSSHAHPAAAWNGSEFVAAWSADTVHAMRFDGALKLLDAVPFEVAPSGIAAFEPSIAPSGPGVEINYVRIDDVPRLFARTLDRIGIVARTRPVTH